MNTIALLRTLLTCKEYPCLAKNTLACYKHPCLVINTLALCYQLCIRGKCSQEIYLQMSVLEDVVFIEGRMWFSLKGECYWRVRERDSQETLP